MGGMNLIKLRALKINLQAYPMWAILLELGLPALLLLILWRVWPSANSANPTANSNAADPAANANDPYDSTDTTNANDRDE